MQSRWMRVMAVMLMALGVTGAIGVSLNVTTARAAAAQPIGLPQPDRSLAATAYTYTTVITVTSGRDLDTSMSTTCSTSPCTLRRAIVQARNATAGQRPVLIRFNIPTTETQSYSSTLGIWHIYLLSTSDASVLRRLNGNIIIDGGTQPGGRATGPKIFLVGPTTGQKDGPVVGDVAGNNGHLIRGLGFQNFGTHLFVNTNNNIIEDNWFGLNDEGTAPYLRANNPQDGSGSGAIDTSGGTTGASSNTIQRNVFLGFDGTAIALKGGSGNVVTDNWIGTNANGVVTGKQTDPSLRCTTVDWLGGGGISLAGVGQVIQHNVIAGLRQEIFAISTQPDALRVTVTGITGHTIQNNRIGVDASNAEVGVCGRGIILTGDMQGTQIVSNTIVDSGMSGISMNDLLYDAATFRRNSIKQTSGWPEVQGNPKPEDAIQYGALLPAPFLAFKPAKVTGITGTQVTGTAGEASACPNCVIEVFLDDNDVITEALQSLAVVTATAQGTWSAVLPAALTPGQGLRTTSTTAQFNTITNMNAGTTTGLSPLYGVKYRVYLPVVIR